jgi:hypothetical protein
MKRIFFVVVFGITAIFLLLHSAPPAYAAACTGAYGFCSDANCSDIGLCPGSGSCTGIYAGWACCQNYGPYCLSSCGVCGCSSDTCTGGICNPGQRCDNVICGCSSIDCNGGVSNKCCDIICPNSTCTPTVNGGYCNPTPTPIPCGRLCPGTGSRFCVIR